uniref:Uncharacterized protein n=1 Tax=Anguilla anguilla TaxID=7936 RepID=A0A0E9SA54_ANGAN
MPAEISLSCAPANSPGLANHLLSFGLYSSASP